MDDKFNNQKVICRGVGGSRAYGLETPTSDTDWRGIFLNVELKYILGLDKYEHQEYIKGEDEKYKEFRHFLNMCRKSNTEAMEMLFNDHWDMVTTEFLNVQKNRLKLIDTTMAFKCLCGYMQGERRLMNGERTGQLGSKRKESIDKFGYSPKNAVQMVRLAWAGCWLFEKGTFPVNVRENDPELCEYLLDVKTHPERYTKAEMNDETNWWEEKMKRTFDSRNFNYEFDNDLANQMVYDMYMPLLKGMEK
jgi:predicted nucleotidyltransferase